MENKIENAKTIIEWNKSNSEKILNLVKMAGSTEQNSSGEKFYSISETDLKALLGWADTLNIALNELN